MHGPDIEMRCRWVKGAAHNCSSIGTQSLGQVVVIVDVKGQKAYKVQWTAYPELLRHWLAEKALIYQ